MGIIWCPYDDQKVLTTQPLPVKLSLLLLLLLFLLFSRRFRVFGTWRTYLGRKGRRPISLAASLSVCVCKAKRVDDTTTPAVGADRRVVSRNERCCSCHCPVQHGDVQYVCTVFASIRWQNSHLICSDTGAARSEHTPQ